MRIKILIALVLALLGGCYVANGQQFIGVPFRPLSAGGCTPYLTAYTADFSGAPYAFLNNNPTGVTDSKVVSFSIWINKDNSGVSGQILYASSGATGTRCSITVSGGNPSTFSVTAQNAAGSTILSVSVANAVTVTTWTHVYITFDLSDSNKRHIYVNGVEASPTWTTYTDDSINFNVLSSANWNIGGNGSGANKYAGVLAEAWFSLEYFNDVTKFYCSGHPADLGPSGLLPTGNQPIFYFSQSGSANSWLTDSSGRGNTFGRTGGNLTTGTSP